MVSPLSCASPISIAWSPPMKAAIYGEDLRLPLQSRGVTRSLSRSEIEDEADPRMPRSASCVSSTHDPLHGMYHALPFPLSRQHW
jgi:hypothetical protein